MTTPHYSILYHLPGDELSLIEIRREDLWDENDPGKLFHWLLLDGTGAFREPLTFRAMEAGPVQQRREFAQGSLVFTDREGTFVDRNTGQAHALRRGDVSRVPAAALNSVETYLLALIEAGDAAPQDRRRHSGSNDGSADRLLYSNGSGLDRK
jgi:hypothetical protein